MNILVTNDDGINSPGLWALAKAMSRVGRVTVIAPDKERSGVGSGLSLHNGINVKKTQSIIPGVSAYAIDGTPSDCVMLGINRLSATGVDMVVSGINPDRISAGIFIIRDSYGYSPGLFPENTVIAVSLYPKTRDEE